MTDFQALLDSLASASRVGLPSSHFAGLGIHVKNPNGDPNNPKAVYGQDGALSTFLLLSICPLRIRP